jgi:hypothetical protein
MSVAVAPSLGNVATPTEALTAAGRGDRLPCPLGDLERAGGVGVRAG